MKNLTKLLCPLFIVFGLFITLGSVSAQNNTETLQPAEATAYFEPVWIGGPGSYLSVNTSSYFNGVSHINGSIINDGDAVTISDHLRVDGSIYRVEVGGEHPVSIADDVRIDGEIFSTEKGGGDRVVINDNLKIVGDIVGDVSGTGNIVVNAPIVPKDGSEINLGHPDNKFSSVYFGYGNIGWLETREFSAHSIVVSSSLRTLGPIDAYESITDGRPNSSLELDDIINIEPREGAPYICEADVKGDIIFSEVAIGINGQADKFYGCDGFNWTMF